MMQEISLDHGELAGAVTALSQAGSRFTRRSLSYGGRKSTITAVDALQEAFTLLQDGFEATGEAVRTAASVLNTSGEVIISEDAAAAGGFTD